MAIRSIAQLKAWFRRGMHPTQEQFADLIDSYVHKEDGGMTITQVAGLAERLNGKYPQESGDMLETGQTKLRKEFDTHVAASDTRMAGIIDDVTMLKDADDRQQGEIDALHETAVFKDDMGAPGGVTPLDNTGKVSARYLPSYVDDVVEFGYVGSVNPDRVQYVTAPPEINTEDYPYNVWLSGGGIVEYVTELNRFAMVYRLNGNQEIVTYFVQTEWDGMDVLGEPTGTGVAPVKGKIYVSDSGKMYRWCGTCLCEIPQMPQLELGSGYGQAFPGSDGKRLKEAVDALTKKVLALECKMERVTEMSLQTETEEPYASLEDALAYMMSLEQDLPGIFMPGMRIVFRMADGDGSRWVTYRFWEGPNEEWDPSMPECWELVTANV